MDKSISSGSGVQSFTSLPFAEMIDFYFFFSINKQVLYLLNKSVQNLDAAFRSIRISINFLFYF